MTNNDIKHTDNKMPKKEPKGWECYWHEKGRNKGYAQGYENALKAQWHPYDKDDKGSWPKKGLYLVRWGVLPCELFDIVTLDYDPELFISSGPGAVRVRDITHYQPITPPKDKDDD